MACLPLLALCDILLRRLSPLHVNGDYSKGSSSLFEVVSRLQQALCEGAGSCSWRLFRCDDQPPRKKWGNWGLALVNRADER